MFVFKHVDDSPFEGRVYPENLNPNMTDDGWIFSTMTWVDVFPAYIESGKNLPAIVMSGISGAFAVQLPGFHVKLFFFSADKTHRYLPWQYILIYIYTR